MIEHADLLLEVPSTEPAEMPEADAA